MAEPIDTNIMDTLSSILSEQSAEQNENETEITNSTEDIVLGDVDDPNEIEESEEEEVEESEEFDEESEEEFEEFEESEESEESEEIEDDVLTEEYYDSAFVELDGEKVSLRALKDGFLRQSDYTRKTQEIAQKKKELENATSEIQEEASERLKERFQVVALDVEKRLSQFQNVDWTKLARERPNDYTALKAEYDETIQEARTLEEEYTLLKEAQTKQVQVKKAEEAKKSFEVLKDAIPSWGKDLYKDIVSYAIQSGMSQEQAVQIVDAPTILMMHKAFLFDKTNKEIKTKVKTKPKASVRSKLKTKANKTVSNDEKSSKRLNSIKSKLSKTTDKNEIRKLNSALVADILKD